MGKEGEGSCRCEGFGGLFVGRSSKNEEEDDEERAIDRFGCGVNIYDYNHRLYTFERSFAVGKVYVLQSFIYISLSSTLNTDCLFHRRLTTTGIPFYGGRSLCANGSSSAQMIVRIAASKSPVFAETGL